jgi:hypothetical protein
MQPEKGSGRSCYAMMIYLDILSEYRSCKIKKAILIRDDLYFWNNDTSV